MADTDILPIDPDREDELQKALRVLQPQPKPVEQIPSLMPSAYAPGVIGPVQSAPAPTPQRIPSLSPKLEAPQMPAAKASSTQTNIPNLSWRNATDLEPHGWRKAAGLGLAALAGGAAGYRNPAQGVEVAQNLSDAFLHGKENLLEKREEQDLAKQKQQAEISGQELTPVTVPGQSEPIMMRRSDVPRYMASLQANQTKENIAGEGNQTKKDIASGNVIAREKIAQFEADNKAALAAGKPQPHITILGDDNKAHIMALDPKSGKYTQDLGVAPPTYAQVAPSLRTIDIIDPTTGLPTVETLGGRQLGISATGAYGHEMAQAGAVGRAGADLEQQLSDPANREILGKLSSYIKQGTLGTPLADQQAAYLSSQLKTFAALQPAMHGFRARSSQEAFEKIVGGLAQDPDATIASIRGILKTASAINPNVSGGGKGAAPPKGAKVRTYNPQTGKLE